MKAQTATVTTQDCQPQCLSLFFTLNKKDWHYRDSSDDKESRDISKYTDCAQTVCKKGKYNLNWGKIQAVDQPELALVQSEPNRLLLLADKFMMVHRTSNRVLPQMCIVQSKKGETRHT